MKSSESSELSEEKTTVEVTHKEKRSTKKIVVPPKSPPPSSSASSPKLIKPNNKKSNFLIKKLKLKGKTNTSIITTTAATTSTTTATATTTRNSDDRLINLSKNLNLPSTSSESSPIDERQTPEGGDNLLLGGKSVSETNLTETSWKSIETIQNDSDQLQIVSNETTILPERTKSLENLKTMPAYGDLIIDSTNSANPNNNTSINKHKDHLYKILVIGDLGAGKTSIIKRYVHHFFTQHYRATIGVDFALKVINWDENTVIRLQLWDIAGQERYGSMTRVYYKEAVGAFIVFDVTRVNTFESVTNWKTDLDSKVRLSDGSPIPCVLLANKCDQPKEGLVNNLNKMNEYCKEKGFTAWFETSAKANINIDQAAKVLVNQILQNDTLLNNVDTNKDDDQFTLDYKMEKNGRNCNC